MSSNNGNGNNRRPGAFVPSGTVDVLESSVPLQGGLMMPKKKSSSTTNAQPQASLLGLDRLAEEKRKALENTSFKKPQESSSGQSFRTRRLDTPSHPGGVSDDAKEKLAAYRSRDKYRGVCPLRCLVSSSNW